MHRLATIWKRETAYFSERMKENVRRLFASNTLKSLSSPLMTIFMNAFLFRVAGGLASVVLYNAGQFVGLPLAFYLDGFLLRRFPVRSLLAWGAIGGAVATAAFVLLGAHAGPLSVLLFGLCWGLGNGFYWSNRNYLELQETFATMRQYFYGAVFAVISAAGVIVPVFAGISIAVLARLGVPLAQAYWAVFGCAFALMLACGLIVARGSFGSSKPERISRFGVGSLFGPRRLLLFASGFTDGAASFIPVLLVFLFLGGEGVLGTLSGAVSLVTAGAMYVYGRSVGTRRADATILLAAVLFLGAALALLFANAAGVVLYGLVSSVAVAFFGLASSPVTLDLSDEEMEGRKELRYSLIFDSELFLNLGRLTSVAILLAAALLLPLKAALIGGSIAIALAHLALILAYLSKRRSRADGTPVPTGIVTG